MIGSSNCKLEPDPKSTEDNRGIPIHFNGLCIKSLLNTGRHVKAVYKYTRYRSDGLAGKNQSRHCKNPILLIIPKRLLEVF